MADTFHLIDTITLKASQYSPLIAIVIGVAFYKHLTFVFQILLCLLIYGFINDQITSVLDKKLIWPLNNMYLLIETIAMGFIFITIEKRLSFKKLIRIVVLVIILIWFGSSLYNPNIYLLQFNRIILPVRSVILSVIAAIMIYDLSGREDYLFRYPAFWVLIGFFFILFCNLIVFLSIALQLTLPKIT